MFHSPNHISLSTKFGQPFGEWVMNHLTCVSSPAGDKVMVRGWNQAEKFIQLVCHHHTLAQRSPDPCTSFSVLVSDLHSLDVYTDINT